MFVPPLLSVLLVDEVDDDALESAAGVGVAATALGLSFVNPLIVNVIWIESDGQRIEGFSNSDVDIS